MAKKKSKSVSSKKERPNIFSTTNLTFLFILGTYAAGAVLSQILSSELQVLSDAGISINSPEAFDIKLRVQQFTVIKLSLMIFRLLISRGLGVGGSGISNAVNLFVLFLINGAANIENVQNTINLFWKFIGDPVELQLEDFLARLNTIDMWIHVLGAANAVAPMPTIVNAILSIAIIGTQLTFTPKLPV